MSTTTSKKLVFKPLDDDCLLDGQLHPAIRQRLNRIRELPITGVANLVGVERVEGVAQLVWEFVPGQNLEEVQADEKTWERIAREVILAIESLHAAGIVHGAIHERNAIVVRDGTVRLTHVSPLLWTETGNDVQDAIAMLNERVALQIPGSDLAGVLTEARRDNWTLDKLYRRLHPSAPQEVEHAAPRLRKRSVLAAALVALVGVAIAMGLFWYYQHQVSGLLPLPGTPGLGRGAGEVIRPLTFVRLTPFSRALSPAHRGEGGWS